MELLLEPVALQCGHIFCRGMLGLVLLSAIADRDTACKTQFWYPKACCPFCKKPSVSVLLGLRLLQGLVSKISARRLLSWQETDQQVQMIDFLDNRRQREAESKDIRDRERDRETANELKAKAHAREEQDRRNRRRIERLRNLWLDTFPAILRALREAPNTPLSPAYRGMICSYICYLRHHASRDIVYNPGAIATLCIRLER